MSAPASSLPRSGARIRSLRLVLPGLMVLFAVSCGLAGYFILAWSFGQEYEAQAMENATLVTSELQNRVEKGIQRNDSEMVQSVISQAGMRPEIRAAVLLDDANTVLAATRRDRIGLKFAPEDFGVGPEDAQRLIEVMMESRLSFRPTRIFTTNRNGVLASQPTALPLRQGDIAVRYDGLLLANLDLTYTRAAGVRRLQKGLGLLIGGILLIGAGLSVSLHYLVTARLRRVNAAMERFAAGRPIEGLGATAPDEIGALKDHFVEMASAIGKEIEDRRQAEDEARRSERLFQAIVEDQTEMIVRWKPDGTRTFVNEAYCRAFGGKPEDHVGKSFYPLIKESYREFIRKKIAALTPENPLETSVHESVAPGGGTYWQEWTDRGLFDNEGRLVELQSTGRDITARREAERRVLELNADLERRVEERTAELLASNKELESFSYSVSHDLRAPLRNVAGFVSLLKSKLKEPPADIERYLTTIDDETRRMGRLIDDLLAFSRLGRAEMRKTPVEMSRLVEEARSSVLPEAGGRNILWTVDALPVIDADRGLMRQVWINLLSNAVKYTRPRECAEIHIGLQGGLSNGEAVFFVQDNGVGFDLKYAAKLFGAFQRLHGPKEFEGTGIGLANVQRIVQRHGGRVWVDAQVNRGATFFFSLPAVVPVDAEGLQEEEKPA